MSIYSDIGLTTSSSSSTSSTSSSSSTTGSSTLSQSDFLELLTTQLAYQDPTSPSDTSEMVSQMAQISMVSSLSELNTTTSGISDVVTSSQALMASSLVGQKALVNSSTGYLSDDGTLSGVIATGDDGASNITVNITNSAGEVVRQYTSSSSVTGDVAFEWDGLDSDGNRCDSGTYKVSANGTVDGTAQSLTTQVYGQVQSVTLGNSSNPTSVMLQGLGSYSLSDLLEIAS